MNIEMRAACYLQTKQRKQLCIEVWIAHFPTHDHIFGRRGKDAEINKRHKRLYPVQREQREEGKRAFLIVDTLFIDGQLFRDSFITPWLY